MTPTDHISTSGPYGHPWRISGAGNRVWGSNARVRGAPGSAATARTSRQRKRLLGTGSVSRARHSRRPSLHRTVRGLRQGAASPGLPPAPQLFPPAHRSTPASRRRFSWCPVHPQSWRAQSHLGGTQRGAALPSGRGTINPPPAMNPPRGPPENAPILRGASGDRSA